MGSIVNSRVSSVTSGCPPPKWLFHHFVPTFPSWSLVLRFPLSPMLVDYVFLVTSCREPQLSEHSIPWCRTGEEDGLVAKAMPWKENHTENYYKTTHVCMCLLGRRREGSTSKGGPFVGWRLKQAVFMVDSYILGHWTVEVIYQTRETVFHRDIQISRRELKIRRAAEYFLTKFEVLG